MWNGLARRAVLNWLQGWHHGQLEVELPSGAVHQFGKPDRAVAAHLQVLDERAFWTALLGGNIGIGEAYMAGQWTSRDLPRLIEYIMRNAQDVPVDRPMNSVYRFVRRLGHRLQRNTRHGSQKNIHAHYDLGNELYQLFLDDTMTYSCALFDREGLSLSGAQKRKIDDICKQLEIGASDHVLEIGCGWAGFAIEAARTTGCKLTTATVSKKQFEMASRRVAEAGLSGQIEVRYVDYRDLAGKFDKIVSIEMFEAVGREHWGTFFKQCDGMLKQRGRMFLQTIALPDVDTDDPTRGATWMHKYIFPGSVLPTLRELQRMTRTATELHIDQVREIGGHYVPTLAAWRERFWESVEGVRALGFPDQFVRMWDYYLALSEGLFAARTVLNYQLVLGRGA